MIRADYRYQQAKHDQGEAGDELVIRPDGTSFRARLQRRDGHERPARSHDDAACGQECPGVLVRHLRQLTGAGCVTYGRACGVLIRSKVRTVRSGPGRSSRTGRLPCGSAGIQGHPAPLLATVLAGLAGCRPPSLTLAHSHSACVRIGPCTAYRARPALASSSTGRPVWTTLAVRFYAGKTADLSWR